MHGPETEGLVSCVAGDEWDDSVAPFEDCDELEITWRGRGQVAYDGRSDFLVSMCPRSWTRGWLIHKDHHQFTLKEGLYEFECQDYILAMIENGSKNQEPVRFYLSDDVHSVVLGRDAFTSMRTAGIKFGLMRFTEKFWNEDKSWESWVLVKAGRSIVPEFEPWP